MLSHGRVVHPGQAQYKASCSQCHGDNGEGIKTLVPPLDKSDFAAKNFDSIPCWLKFGLNHPIKVNDTLYDQPMYPNPTMDEVQTANVMNYMSKEFFGLNHELNPDSIRKHWQNCN
jgi:mono/diheme cytochrome c family protein